MYPLAEFDGSMKQHDWSKLPKFTSPGGAGGGAETKWVFPETFLDQLPLVLADAPPRPGEEARYAQMLAAVAAAKEDPAYRPDAVLDVARRAFGQKKHNAYVLYHPRQTLVDHRDESPLAARAPTVVMPAPPIKRRLVTRTAG